MKISQTVMEFWGVHIFLGKCKIIKQRGITQKLRKGEQLFLYVTHRLDRIHIPIKGEVSYAPTHGFSSSFTW